jgi:hypothetical protein
MIQISKKEDGFFFRQKSKALDRWENTYLGLHPADIEKARKQGFLEINGIKEVVIFHHSATTQKQEELF